jgi:hypothetical protein
VRSYREGKREGDTSEKPLANSFARAIPYSRSSLPEPLFGTQTRNRHELLVAIKLSTDGDLTLATARCSYLTEFEVGNLHEERSRYKEDTSRVMNSLSARRFIFFSPWTACPTVGFEMRARQARHADDKESPTEVGLRS